MACTCEHSPLLEGDLSGDVDLGAVTLDGDVVGELANLAVDLDLGVEERLLCASVNRPNAPRGRCPRWRHSCDERRGLCRPLQRCERMQTRPNKWMSDVSD